MEKKLIKYRIKKLQFVETKWFSTNPCLEIELPVSGETARFIVPNFDFASLYDNVMPTLNVDRLGDFNVIMGTPSGIEPLYESVYRRRQRRPSWRDYVNDFNRYDDEQPF